MARTALKAVPTIGSLIEALASNRDERAKITEAEKKLNEEKETLEQQLIEMLDAQGTDRAANAHFTASITRADKFSAPKESGAWEVFMEKVVAKNKMWHAVQARVSDPVIREFVELRGLNDTQLEKLGITRFEKRSISLRKL